RASAVRFFCFLSFTCDFSFLLLPERRSLSFLFWRSFDKDPGDIPSPLICFSAAVWPSLNCATPAKMPNLTLCGARNLALGTLLQITECKHSFAFWVSCFRQRLRSSGCERRS